MVEMQPDHPTSTDPTTYAESIRPLRPRVGLVIETTSAGVPAKKDGAGLDQLINALVVHGDEKDIEQQLRDLLAAGLDELLLHLRPLKMNRKNEKNYSKLSPDCNHYSPQIHNGRVLGINIEHTPQNKYGRHIATSRSLIEEHISFLAVRCWKAAKRRCGIVIDKIPKSITDYNL